MIPPLVAMEVRAKPDSTSAELDRFISSASVQAPQNRAHVQKLSAHLGIGEAEAIVLASEHPGAVLIMDDAEGRRAAQGLGISVTGLLGILVEAKVRGSIQAVAPTLDQLVAEGFWLSQAMRRRVLDAVGE